MDPPTVGTICSLPGCEVVDFLPLRCGNCGLLFCTEHGLPASLHACIADPSTATVTGNRFVDKFRDLLPDPNRSVPDRDDAAKERDRKRDAARAVLEKNFGKDKVAKLAARNGAAPAAVKAKAKNPAIELMRLKQRATAGDPRKSAGDVPMDQRIYWTTLFLDCESGKRVEKGSKELWMPKSTSVGKALDLLADHFKIENINNLNPPPTKILRLTNAAGEPILTAMRLESCGVANGGTMHLVRGTPPSSSDEVGEA